MESTEPTTRGARLAARVEALATRRNALWLLAAVTFFGLAFFFLRPTYPNYDSYYTLLWGDQLASGDLPDYDVFRTPTPHPLSTLVAAGLSQFGGAADRVLVLLTLAAYVGLLAALFRFSQILLGTLVAVVAVAILVTRTDIAFFASRAIVDVPFLMLVFTAAVMELSRPRRGWPVLVLLTLAGLLRPEAWVFAGLYALWLSWKAPARRAIGYLALAGLAPVLWLLADWAVTGEPLYSLTSTREVAGQFKRDRGVIEAIGLIPDYVGGNEKIVNVVAGGLGGVLAFWLLRARAWMPLAFVAVSGAVFLMIAAAGLSVIPRYLVIPSLVFNLCVGVAIVGWTLVESQRARRIALGLAALALLLMLVRTPSYVKDLRKLNGQTTFSSNQHRDLKAILDDSRVVPLLDGACGRITVPTHSAIPVVRYETGLDKNKVSASINQTRPPDEGVLLIGETFNFEPSAARSTSSSSENTAQKWWSNYPLADFRPVARNDKWRVYANCKRRAPA